MSAPRCKGKTKAGKRCKAHPLKGKDTCIAHSDKETRGSTGFGGPQPGSGRPRNPRAVDILRERIEADVDGVLNVLFDALAADRGLALMVKGGGMEIGYVVDHETRIRAARELLDRAYGKPKQTTELSGPEGQPVRIELPSAEDWHRDVAAVLAETGAAA